MKATNILMAKSLIPKWTGKEEILCKKGCEVIDIVNGIMNADADPNAAKQTEAYSEYLRQKYGTKYKKLFKEVWQELRKMQYVEDSEASQDIKLPSALFTIGHGDCKSYSLFVAAICQNLQIPYSYRFTNYEAKLKEARHVYVIVHLKNQDIIVDGVWNRYNNEKIYNWVQDYNMGRVRKIGRVRNGSGTQSHRWPNIQIDPMKMDDDSFYDYVAIKTSYYQRNKAGSNYSEQRIREIALDKLQVKHETNGANGNGDVVRFFNRLDQSAQYAGDAFLYLFFNTESIVHNLPPLVREKRRKAQDFLEEISATTGISETDFMDFCRRQFRRAYGISPERYIANAIAAELGYNTAEQPTRGGATFTPNTNTPPTRGNATFTPNTNLGLQNDRGGATIRGQATIGIAPAVIIAIVGLVAAIVAATADIWLASIEQKALKQDDVPDLENDFNGFENTNPATTTLISGDEAEYGNQTEYNAGNASDADPNKKIKIGIAIAIGLYLMT
ncbi:MAG: hypothetical protein ACPG5B_06820 [Chitinophagales bacterium]